MRVPKKPPRRQRFYSRINFKSIAAKQIKAPEIIDWYVLLLVHVQKPGHTNIVVLSTKKNTMKELLSFSQRLTACNTEFLPPGKPLSWSTATLAEHPPTISYVGSHWKICTAVYVGNSREEAMQFAKLVSEDAAGKQIRGLFNRGARFDVTATRYRREFFTFGDVLLGIAHTDKCMKKRPYTLDQIKSIIHGKCV